jgi:uncharacterized protein
VLAVLDPNVLVSAAISTAGPPRQIVSAWVDGGFELLVSATLIDELAGVLARPRLRRWISTATASEFVAGLEESAVIIDDPPEPAALTADPDDDYLIALARAGGADYLVSGDRHLTELADADPPVLTPRQFLELLTA